ncbi:MAG: DUF4924 family protein [Bacteroidales bacterium]|nr:DUF4924 family protein [Bacteroidales bacterium]
MLIATQKRKENIAEYLLYMWQVEDMIRACQCDDEKIEQLLVARFRGMEGIGDKQIQEIETWYLNLRNMMLQEGKREKGHLQINENILIDLTDLHLRLLKNGHDAIYTSAFYSTLPIIVELRSKEGAETVGELETCFLALYGVLMLRLRHKEIGKETLIAVQQISKFLAQLAEKYRQWKNGELKLDEE